MKRILAAACALLLLWPVGVSAKELRLTLRIPIAAGDPAPLETAEPSPTPTPEESPTPSPEESPTPTPEESPAPAPEESPAPAVEEPPEAQGTAVAPPESSVGPLGRALAAARGAPDIANLSLEEMVDCRWEVPAMQWAKGEGGTTPARDLEIALWAVNRLDWPLLVTLRDVTDEAARDAYRGLGFCPPLTPAADAFVLMPGEECALTLRLVCDVSYRLDEERLAALAAGEALPALAVELSAEIAPALGVRLYQEISED